MRSCTAIVAGLALLAEGINAHYIFQQFTYGGVKYPVGKYIRPNTNYNSPVTDVTSNDLRCNVGGGSGASTDTIVVSAGSSFSFTTDTAVYHQGPLSIYMAKAPTTAAEYDGSGQAWFKIFDLGPVFNADGTATWTLASTYTATLPSALPNGDYLLRVQQLAIHNPYPSLPQFYDACAQVTVTGGGSGVPGPLVSIPGFITGTEPGYTANIYSNFHNYTIPGPPVWAGGNSGTGTSAKPVTSTGVKTSTSSVKTTVSTTLKTSTTSSAPAGGATGTVAKYGQCGGIGYTGPTVCAAGSTCTASGAYYSQCL